MPHTNFGPLEAKPRFMKSSIICRNAPITVMSHPLRLVVVGRSYEGGVDSSSMSFRRSICLISGIFHTFNERDCLSSSDRN